MMAGIVSDVQRTHNREDDGVDADGLTKMKRGYQKCTTSSQDDLAKKIKVMTEKRTKLIHLGEPLRNAGRSGVDKSEPSIELPALLQVNAELSKPTELVVHNERKPLKEIFRDSKKSMWLFYGPAGSGKTTLLKTIARNTLENVYEGLRGIEIVIFLRCGDLNTKKITSVSKLLLGNAEPEFEKSELQQFRNVTCKDASNVLVLLDGMDMLPKSFYSRVVQQVVQKNMEKCSVADILVHLLTGKCLPRCRIIASSRNFEIFEKIPSLRGQMTPVYLLGLEDESIFHIARQYLEDIQAEKLMQFLETKPSLLDLCRTPIFLIATALGQRENPDFAPSNVSETLIYLIGQFIRSAHSRSGENEVKALKEIAFILLKENKFDFDPEILSKYQADRNKQGGLLCDTPGQRNRIVFFIHQSIHEMFAALHLAGATKILFQKEVGSFVATHPFAFRCLGGLLCHEGTFTHASELGLLHRDVEWREKQKLFREILRKEVKKISRSSCDPMIVLNTVHALHECESAVKNDIASCLKSVNLDLEKFPPLPISDMHALSSVAIFSQSLQELSLHCCGLGSQHLKVLISFFEKNKKQVTKLKLSRNPLTNEAVMLAGVFARICYTGELDISGTVAIQNDPSSLLSLKSGLGNHKLKVLNISYNDKDVKESEMKAESEKKDLEYVYKLVPGSEDRRALGIALPGQITHRICLPGLWKDASYDMTRAIERIIPNVTETVFMRCWKFSDEWKTLLLNNLNTDHRQNLLLVLSKDCVIKCKRDTPSVLSLKTQSTFIDCPMIEDADKKTLHSETNNAPTRVPEDFGNGLVQKEGSIDDAHGRFKCSEQSVDKEVVDCHLEKQPEPYLRIMHRPVNNDDLKHFENVLSAHQNLEEITLRDCGLSKDFFCNLLKKIESTGKHIQVGKLSITAEREVTQLIPTVCKLLTSCNISDLNLEESDVSNATIERLLECIGDLKLKALNLSYVNGIDDFSHLGRLLSGRVRQLHLVNCDLDISSIQGLQSITDSQVEYLDISFNPMMDYDSISLLPNIFGKGNRVTLVMQGCDLTEDEVDAFQTFKGFQVQLLDLSYNDDLEEDGIEKVGKFANESQTSELRLSSCALNEDCIDALIATLNQKLDKVDLSGNPQIIHCSEKIASLLFNTNVSDFKFSDCKLYDIHIQDLVTSLKKHHVKLKHIDISDRGRRYLDQNYFNAVKLLSSQVEEKSTLHLSEKCSPSWLDQFRSIERLEFKMI